MEFEWDPAKAARNRREHGVSFEEASEVFDSTFALTGSDVAHSSAEPRERTLGRSNRGRVLVAISTRRNGVIRLISARKASASEANAHEKEIQRRLRVGP